MKILKKIFFVCLLFGLILFLGTQKANAGSSSEVYLNNLEFEVKVNDDGSMNVTELWTTKVKNTNTLFKTFEVDNSQYSEITDVKVKDRTLNVEYSQIDEEMYHVTQNCFYALTNSKGKYEIAWGIGVDNNTVIRTYQIDYKVVDAVAKYNDCAELYWQFIGEKFQVNAKNVSGKITLPSKAKSKDDIRVWGHTENLNGEIYATDTDKIEFQVYGYDKGNFVEVRTLFPTNLISSSGRTYDEEHVKDVVAEETKWSDEANKKREDKEKNQLFGAIAVCVVALAVDAFLIKKLIDYIKELKGLEKIQPSQQLEYYRDIPREDSTPAEALYLIKKKMFDFESIEVGRIFSATLLDLSLKKLVEFESDNNEKDKDKILIKIIENPQSQDKLIENEKIIYEFLGEACSTEKSITVKELTKYIKGNETKVLNLKNKIDTTTKENLIAEQIINREESEKYKNKISKITLYRVLIIIMIIASVVLLDFLSNVVLIGTASIIIMAIINIIYLKKVRSKINVYTQKGVDEVEEWKGLKKYMENFSMLDKREAPEIAIWEKFLVYATAFNIADKVLKQLKIVYPDFEKMEEMRNATYMGLMMNTNFSSSFSNSVSSAMTTTYSSGSGAGGGFSGGRRRRSVAGGGRRR